MWICVLGAPDDVRFPALARAWRVCLLNSKTVCRLAHSLSLVIDGNPHASEIQVSCFEVCLALAPLCTAYSVDLTPINESDFDIDNRELRGHCLIYSRPQQNFTGWARRSFCVSILSLLVVLFCLDHGSTSYGHLICVPGTERPWHKRYRQLKVWFHVDNTCTHSERKERRDKREMEAK